MYRTARVEDKTNIAALMIQVWLHTYATEGLRGKISRFVFSEFTEEKIGIDIISEQTQYIVCEINDHIVGVAVLDLFADCPVTKSKYPELRKLYIQEHFSQKGFGSGLLEKAIEYCRETKLEKLWLTVNPNNLPAVEFYKKHEFVKVGVEDFKIEDECHENYVLHKATV